MAKCNKLTSLPFKGLTRFLLGKIVYHTQHLFSVNAESESERSE